MAKTNRRISARLRRKKHIRKTLRGTSERPRLSVFRSSKHIYAQIIDDDSGTTVVSASSMLKECSDVDGGNREGAAVVGKIIAERALAANITTVVFDRNGFRYHGRLAAMADAAREAGLKF